MPTSKPLEYTCPRGGRQERNGVNEKKKHEYTLPKMERLEERTSRMKQSETEEEEISKVGVTEGC